MSLNDDLRIVIRISQKFSQASNWWRTSFDSDDDLTTNMRQTIIWPNESLVYRLIYPSLNINEWTLEMPLEISSTIL